jgi:enoyl-[acyl-carrier protein] reductase I
MTDTPKGLVIGIANADSIAWACAQAFHAQGARLFVTYENEDNRRAVEALAGQIGAECIMPLDVRDDRQMDAVFAEIRTRWGGLDFLLHSIVYTSNTEGLDDLLNSTCAGFNTAMDISCHSLIRLAARSRHLMPSGGSILTMSYYGAEKVMPHFDFMGPVKAALESSVRYLAWELGLSNIRVNAMSPGPIRTRMEPNPSRFAEMMTEDPTRIPNRKCVVPQQIGDVAAFLVSEKASGINGQVIHVDNGFTAVG